MTASDESATCAQTYATLRVMDVDPAVVSTALGLEPTRVQRRGDPLRRGTVKRDGWFLVSENQLDSLDVRDHLAWLLERVRSCGAAFEALRHQGALTDISCYWESAFGHGGPSVRPDQARELAELGLEIWFDVYFPHTGARTGASARPAPTHDLYDRVAAKLLHELEPSRGLDITGFRLDLEEALRRCAAIDTFAFRTRASADDAHVEVEATVASGVDSLQSLARALRQISLGIAYRTFQASAIDHFRDATVLRFATASPPSLFITGQLEVRGGRYARLAEEYERGFGPLRRQPT